MSRLTQRKAGRSDNNEAGETTYFNANMAGKNRSMLSFHDCAQFIWRCEPQVDW